MRSPSLHRVRIAVLVAGSLAGPVIAAQPCDAAPPARLLERFIPADCEACWQDGPAPASASASMVLDWIVPAGDGAPLAGAATPDAKERAAGLRPGRTLVRRSAWSASRAPQLRIVDGPAWNGYIGLRLVITRHGMLPRGARAYAALVEQVPAGNEGSSIERRLVRAVAGPMGLDELATEPTVEHLRAVAVPSGARVDRLVSVAWIEAPGGRVLAAAASPPEECR